MMIYLDKFIDNAFRNAMYGDVFTTTTGYRDLVRNEKEKSVISLAVPGISKEDIDLEVKEEGVLTLSFKKKTDFFTSSHKSWTLPEDIDVENVTAECKDGLLTVTLPKAKRLPASRKVEIL
jgi:HSP20 family protein